MERELILVCKTPCSGLTKGKHYKAYESATSHQYDLISIIDDKGTELFFSKRRFITLEQWKQNARTMLIQKRKMIRDY